MVFASADLPFASLALRFASASCASHSRLWFPHARLWERFFPLDLASTSIPMLHLFTFSRVIRPRGGWHAFSSKSTPLIWYRAPPFTINDRKVTGHQTAQRRIKAAGITAERSTDEFNQQSSQVQMLAIKQHKTIQINSSHDHAAMQCTLN